MHDSLLRAPEAYDLVIAADVFVYVGNLAPAFAASARALVAGGRLAFTTERAEGDGFDLQPTGRFRHGEAYVRRLAREHGFDVEVLEEVVLRRQRGKRRHRSRMRVASRSRCGIRATELRRRPRLNACKPLISWAFTSSVICTAERAEAMRVTTSNARFASPVLLAFALVEMACQQHAAGANACSAR